MKRIPLLLLLFACLSGSALWGQETQKETPHRNFSVTTQQAAAYPGGEQALYSYLFQKIEYPEAAREKRIEGDLYISFFVETDSSISEVSALNDLGGGTKEEAIRVVKTLKYGPAIQNGKPIRQNVMISVPFRIYD